MLRHLAIVLGLLVVAGGCLSPTLPLPPPDEPQSISQGADGLWTVSGTCIEGAQVTVLDEETGRGAVFVDQNNTGHYSVQLAASLCDNASVIQSRGDAESDKTGFAIHPRLQGEPDMQSACP